MNIKTEQRPQDGEWTPAEIRRRWVDYFSGKKNHLHMRSASLIPSGDPTLLFTTAGMVQFKPYFAGTEEPPSRRVVTIQKCLRTTDLDSVGKTERHCTFFEMLGNFSFGDYFKNEAIHYAYEFSTEYLGFDPERIHVTVYEDDDEAVVIWNEEIGVPLTRITRLGKEHNWWGPAGDSGACGPCSELYLDRGAERCTCEDKTLCRPGADCDRFMEYWNLVFNQFHQDTSGNLHSLPLKGIDTGAGLERIVMLLNGLDSVYDTPEMAKIIQKIEKITSELRDDGKPITYTHETAPSFRVLADHLRASSFAIADGILPDNGGRGYVIRRLIRRAMLFARELGINRSVLSRLVPDLIEIYSPFYPELTERKEEIENCIRSEEERFLHTLEQGLKILNGYLGEHRARGVKLFGGAEAFRLYDTYGFPLEITKELARREGMLVDEKGFEELMNHQREMASHASAFRNIVLPALPVGPGEETLFNGHENLSEDSKIIAIVQNDAAVELIESPASAMLILERTPFYPEGGGQLGDSGRIISKSGAMFLVRDTQKNGGLIVHTGDLISGSMSRHEIVNCEVDRERRERLTRHHSATHLLNASLRKILGPHVMQTGSLVSPDYLRFDFSHSGRIEPETLNRIERDVVNAIEKSASVVAELLPIEKAKETGAVAAFGEKYGETVRVVGFGESGELSREFCGGCHVKNTGDIHLFHITKEGSPGAGNRRIEAVAGDGVIRFFQGEFESLAAKIAEFNEKAGRAITEGADRSEGRHLLLSVALPDHAAIASMLRLPSSPLDLAGQLEEIEARLSRKEKELSRFLKELREERAGELLSGVDDLIQSALIAGETAIISRVFDDQEVGTLRKLGDALKAKRRNSVILLGNRDPKGALLLFMANRGAIEAGVDCGGLIAQVSASIGGRGGGRPDMAQAGGAERMGLEGAIDAAVAIVRKTCEK
jgi:alanyl-tRNA synthetase